MYECVCECVCVCVYVHMGLGEIMYVCLYTFMYDATDDDDHHHPDKRIEKTLYDIIQCTIILDVMTPPSRYLNTAVPLKATIIVEYYWSHLAIVSL